MAQDQEDKHPLIGRPQRSPVGFVLDHANRPQHGDAEDSPS